MEGMRSDSALTRTKSLGQHAYVFSDLDLDTHHRRLQRRSTNW